MEIYRFKFDTDISEKIATFSSLHCNESLTDFKKHWAQFIITNKDIIELENRRLCNAGMTMDVVDKMFSSARYWHTKKNSVTKKEKENKTHTSINRVFLVAMDAHIQKSGSTMKPSIAFEHFCEHNRIVLKTEIDCLKAATVCVDEIRVKIKKTYKNRHFVMKNCVSPQ